MTKKLNIEQIQSELRGGSAFFPGYKGGHSPTAASEEPNKGTTGDVTTNENLPTKENDRVKGVPPTVPRTGPRPVPLLPKVKRLMRQRQPFDIYEDQYQTLKKIADAERGFINGRGMSQMVREAIDQYLKNNSSSKK
jgi:hypothetical protein